MRERVGDRSLSQLAIAWSAAIFVGALLLVLTSTRFTTTVSSDAYYRQPGFFPAILALSAGGFVRRAPRAALWQGSFDIAADEELVGTRAAVAGFMAPLVIGFRGYMPR